MGVEVLWRNRGLFGIKPEFVMKFTDFFHFSIQLDLLEDFWEVSSLAIEIMSRVRGLFGIPPGLFKHFSNFFSSFEFSMIFLRFSEKLPHFRVKFNQESECFLGFHQNSSRISQIFFNFEVQLGLFEVFWETSYFSTKIQPRVRRLFGIPTENFKNFSDFVSDLSLAFLAWECSRNFLTSDWISTKG